MPADEREIRALISTWMVATKSGDIATVLGLMTDDAVFLAAGHAPMLGRAAFAQAAKWQAGGQAPRIEGSSQIEELQVIGDRAFTRANLSVVITPLGGAPGTRKGPTLTLFRREGGQWRLARDANMLAPDSPSEG